MALEGAAAAAAERSIGLVTARQNVPVTEVRKTRRSIFKGLQKVGKRFSEVPSRKPHNSEPSVGQRQNRPGKPGRFISFRDFESRSLDLEHDDGEGKQCQRLDEHQTENHGSADGTRRSWIARDT